MTQIVCANCGQALRPTDKFCYNCGAKVQPVKLKPEVEKAVPKPEPVKTAPSVFKTQVQPRPEAPKQEPPKPDQTERPKFHMDEAMSWNTDGYPEAQRHPVQEPEEADFSWNDSTAQDRIKKRQEEGRRALFEEHEEKEVEIEKAEAETAPLFEETPEAEDVVKAVDAESTVPVESFQKEEAVEEAAAPAAEAAPEEAYMAPRVEAPAEGPVEAPAAEEAPEEAYMAPETPVEIPVEDVAEKIEEVVAPVEEAAAPVEEAYAEPAAAEKAEAALEEPAAPAASFRDAYQAVVDQSDEEAEADDDYVVPTIESIEKDAEAAKARETEKEIFGYTLDDIDSGARAEGSSGAEVIDKFYTYSKKNEEFQQLLDQENDKLKGGRPEAVQAGSDIREELEKAVSEVEAEKEPIDTGGFVGVQLPETPVEAYEAHKPEMPEALAADDAYKAPSAFEAAPEIPAAEAVEAEPEAPAEPAEFLDGNFGKADTIAHNAEAQESDDKSAAANTVAAAAGAVAAGAAAIAAAREKARARIEAEKAAAAETEAAVETPAPAEAAAPEAPEAAPTEDKPFGEVITEESELEREKSLAEEAEEAARAKAAEIKAAEEAAAAEEGPSEVTEEHLEEAQKSIDKVIEETAAPAEEPAAEVKDEDEHKLTYQDVFNEEAEKTPKHTFLKIIAILILLLIILEVAAILIRRFAPDSPAGIQIQQAYEMIFSRFI